jgi:large repetitive protein
VLYRTTYVSRVPAPFQPVKDDTNAPNITLPANLPSNYWLVTIIDRLLSKTNPTRLEIGNAIDTVLGTPGQSPGLLKDLIPWWADFYTAANVYGTVAFRELADLRVNLLNYMVSKYEAEQYRLN